MSRIYLVRHGQAGTREAYDSLSDLGRCQARWLGEYFAAQQIHFTAAYSGELVRQQQTAEQVRGAYLSAGVAFPEVAADAAWNEFDLDHVYQALAPLLCAEDAGFQKEYEEMVAQARVAAEQPDAPVNRRWLPCDKKLVQAWIEGKHPYNGESWKAFRERVTAGRMKLQQGVGDQNIVVFTSATPIAIWAALAMEIEDVRVMRLAGVLHNSSCSVVRLIDQELRLHSFNEVPHLRSPELRTYR